MNRPGLYLGTQVDGGDEVVVAPLELTTHAFCVGMTGSGKTGLCAVLIEELLGQGIPVIAVDPKGDLGNLLLPLDPGTPSEFGEWLRPNEGTASSPEDAAQRATAGLTESHLGREDLLRYRGGHRAKLYTPGATFGIPLDLLGSLAPPEGGPAERAEAADGLTRAVLGLLELDADPVRSRDYLLLRAIIAAAFEKGQTLTLADLVRGIADPPFETLGALPLEVVYPAKERNGLMLAVNGLLASPSFEAWRQGEPFDLGKMLSVEGGKPQLSVYSIAHLSESERLFATALLLDRVVAWMRKQPGTGELRAVLYMDEIYGYFPPYPADPPTKKPLLTLLKQARAFGLGVVLTTQNPVDLDYKGLANIGTWFVGKLQTEQDRARLREGLAGPTVAPLMERLEKRVFLHHSIHRPSPALLRSRYAYSFLRGPLSQDEVAKLAGTPNTSTSGANSEVPKQSPPAASSASASPRAIAPTGAPELVLSDPALGPLYGPPQGKYSPHLVVKLAVRLRVGRSATDEKALCLAFPLSAQTAMSEMVEKDPIEIEEAQLSPTRPSGFVAAPAPSWLGSATADKLIRVAKERLPSRLETKLFFDPKTRLLSQPGESREAFSARVAAEAKETSGSESLQRKLEKKKLELAQAQEQLSGRKAEKWASLGGAVLSNLGLVFGKKRTISGVGSVLSKNRLEGSAEAKVASLTSEISQLEAQLADVQQVEDGKFEEHVSLPTGKDLAVFKVLLAYL